MTKILKCVKPYFVMEPGDTLELSEVGKTYTSNYRNEYHADSTDDTVSAWYNSDFTITSDYAKTLVDDGYFELVNTNEQFVNVFDEIDRLSGIYSSQLADLNKDCANEPACVKIEKETVLSNMVKLLSHLKELKK